MRRLSYSMLVSLDGYIEDADGSVDFTVPDEELHRHFNERELEVGTHLYGRLMYEAMVPFWSSAEDDASIPDYAREYAHNWQRAENVVFSRTLERVEHGARLVRDGAVAEVRRLKALPGKELDVGGANLAATLMAAGLIDEYRLYVNPVVVGGGKPYFPAGVRMAGLELAEVARFGGGVVMLRYEARQP